MNEKELLKHIERIAEAVAMLIERVQALEEQNTLSLKIAAGSKPCKIIPMRIEKRSNKNKG